jgi:hypothetical protein
MAELAEPPPTPHVLQRVASRHLALVKRRTPAENDGGGDERAAGVVREACSREACTRKACTREASDSVGGERKLEEGGGSTVLEELHGDGGPLLRVHP